MSNILILQIEKLEQRLREKDTEIRELRETVETLKTHSKTFIDFDKAIAAVQSGDLPEGLVAAGRKLLKAHGIDA